MATSLCKSCGAEIVWGKTANGTKVPLDPKPPVYSIVGSWEPNLLEILKTQPGEAYVSHFATCKNPAPFSGKSRKSLSPMK